MRQHCYLSDTYMPGRVVVTCRFCVTVWSLHFIK